MEILVLPNGFQTILAFVYCGFCARAMLLQNNIHTAEYRCVYLCTDAKTDRKRTVEVIAYHFVALHIDIEMGYTFQPSQHP